MYDAGCPFSRSNRQWGGPLAILRQGLDQPTRPDGAGQRRLRPRFILLETPPYETKYQYLAVWAAGLFARKYRERKFAGVVLVSDNES